MNGRGVDDKALATDSKLTIHGAIMAMCVWIPLRFRSTSCEILFFAIGFAFVGRGKCGIMIHFALETIVEHLLVEHYRAGAAVDEMAFAKNMRRGGGLVRYEGGAMGVGRRR